MRSINIKCPECGCTKAEATATCTVSTPIFGVEDDKQGIVYDTNHSQIIDGDNWANYACEKCGYVFFVGSDDQFLEYLEYVGGINDENN